MTASPHHPAAPPVRLPCPHREPALARRWRRSAILGLALLLAAPIASVPPRAAIPPAQFWDRHDALRELLAQRPDSARALAESMLREEPGEILGHWLRGACLSLGDSAGGAECVARATARPDDAGLQIEAGIIHLQARRLAAGRDALDRARDLYLAGRDTLSAARVVFWKTSRSIDRGERLFDPEADAEAAEAMARRARDPATLAAALIYRGERGMRRDLKAAVPRLSEALALLSALPPSRQLVACRRDLGSALRSLGDYDGSETHYQSAMEMAHVLGDSVQEVRSLMGIGSIRKAQGRYDEAEDIQRRALALALAGSDLRLTAVAYYDLGTLQWETARYKDAKLNMLASLRAMDDAHWETDNRVSLLDGLGGVETSLGNFEEARKYLEQALEIVKARNLKALGAFVYLHLANLHRELGELETARDDADAGIRLAREAGQKRIESVLLSMRARVLIDLDQDDDALAAAREGEHLAREVEPRNLWRMRTYVAQSLGELGRPEEGIAVLESTLTAPGGTADSSEIGYVLQVQGDLLVRSGEGKRAAAVLSRSLAISRALENPRRIADLELSLGPALTASGRPREAMAVLDDGLRWFESTQSGVRSSEERSGYQAQWQWSYYALARAQVRSGRPKGAFATFERSRARELRRLIGLRSRALRNKVPANLARDVERVEGDLTALQATLLHEYETPSERRGAAVAALEHRTDSLKTEWAALNRRVQREAPAYAREAGLLPAVSADEVLRRLAPGERLVAFMVGDEGTLVFDFARGKLSIHERPIGEDTLARRVEAVTAEMRSGSAGPPSRAADALADALIGPCRLAEDPPRTLYVIPDAALHYLPFEALTVAGAPGRPRRYVVQCCGVSYANSATLLLHPPIGKPRTHAGGATAASAGAGRGGLIAFGDPALPAESATSSAQRGALPALGPLPHARREVEALRSYFGGARVYVGGQATEGEFFAQAGRASILHVAAHAFVDDRHPEFSGVVLAPSDAAAGRKPTDDGLVQAFEVVQQNYDLDLATLSACESGSGRLQRGEGLIGLSRAFRLAGARNLLVSLWKVDDAATADFMIEFYARLARGESPEAALRGAKLAFLGDTARERASTPSDGSEARGVGRHARSQSLAAPAAWASFVLLGSRAP